MSEKVTIIVKGFLKTRGRWDWQATAEKDLARVPVKGDVILIPDFGASNVDVVHLDIYGGATVYLCDVCEFEDESDEITEKFKNAGFEVAYLKPKTDNDG